MFSPPFMIYGAIIGTVKKHGPHLWGAGFFFNFNFFFICYFLIANYFEGGWLETKLLTF